jgi:hypothetical protein
MAHSLGIEADHDFVTIHNSNMTKFCKTEDEAQKTVEWYRINKGDLYDSPIYEKVDDLWVVKNNLLEKF